MSDAEHASGYVRRQNGKNVHVSEPTACLLGQNRRDGYDAEAFSHALPRRRTP